MLPRAHLYLPGGVTALQGVSPGSAQGCCDLCAALTTPCESIPRHSQCQALGCAPKHCPASSTTPDQCQHHHEPVPAPPRPWHELSAPGRPRWAGFDLGEKQGMQQGTAGHCLARGSRSSQHPLPPSPGPGEPWSSPRVFPQSRPSLQALGSSPQALAFPPKAEAGEHAQPKGP